MSDIYVTETDEAQLQANSQAVRLAMQQQRRRESIQATVTAVLAFGVVLALLALIALFPSTEEEIQIITYQAETVEEEPPIKMEELTRTRQPKPPGASSSMAKVMAAQAEAPVAVPVPVTANPDSMFGMEEDFGPGFGTGTGDGDGGGGASFFGSQRKGRNVVFCVDFSGSMQSDTADGKGTRIGALKEELERSIMKLPSGMNVSVIFYSTTAWTIDTKGDDPQSAGFRGNGEVPEVVWYPANDQYKAIVVKAVKDMPAKGGTNWYPPLRMAFAMNPRPDILYLLSDGQPTDADFVLERMDELNPSGVPIDTIAFELPGTPAAQLMAIAEETGGKFSMIYEGKRLRGRSAEELTGVEYD